MCFFGRLASLAVIGHSSALFLLFISLLSTRGRPVLALQTAPHFAGDGPRPVRAGSGLALVLLTGVSAEVSGVKRDFACTFTRHFSPVLVARRS